MANEKQTETEETDVEETETEETESSEADEAGWTRMQEMIDASVAKGLESWQARQKTTSTGSRPRPVKKEAPKRKQGFLSGQFFSNLNPDK